MTTEPKIGDYIPPTTDSSDFAAVSREVLLSLLDAILKREGDSDWTRDAAMKLHFGLVHGLGSAEALVTQAKDEERERCAALLGAEVLSHTITVCGDGRPDVLLKQGQVPREFPTFAAAQKEARRLNVVAESKGVPWRYVPTVSLNGSVER